MRNQMPFMAAQSVPSSTILTTTASQAVALGVQCNSVYLANVGSNPAYIKFGDANVTAAKPTDVVTTESVVNMCIPVGFYGVIGTNGQSYIAAISTSALPTTLRFTPGEGFL